VPIGVPTTALGPAGEGDARARPLGRSVIFERSCMRNRIVVEEELTRPVPHEGECQEAEQREHWRAPLIQCGRPHLSASLVGSWGLN
jgi:hypothetical protein